MVIRNFVELAFAILSMARGLNAHFSISSKLPFSASSPAQFSVCPTALVFCTTMTRRHRLLGEGRLASNHAQRLVSEPITVQQVSVIEAAQIADLPDLDKECILERSRVVSIAPARMPYISYFGKYNKRWYVDIVSLPHNSVRMFISLLFESLTATHIMALDMTKSDFSQLFSLISHFRLYLSVLLDAEDKILYAELDPILKKRQDYSAYPLNPSIRNRTRANISSLLCDITHQTLQTTPSIIVAQTLQTKLDALSTELQAYFKPKENDLPRILVKSIRGAKEKTRMEKRLIKYFDGLHQEMFFTALLITPLQNEQVRIDFEQRHFSKHKIQQLRAEVSRLENTLFSIPKQFDKAARKYESRFSMNAFLENYGTDRDLKASTEIIS